MDSTPALEGDPAMHSTSMLSYPHSSPPSSGQSAHGGEQSISQSGHSSSQPKFSNGPHIRSRITVVCAECKRLKLKCDRRTPCSSCLKRDTVQRCVYSQAAAEKIDVQSLHNRILVLESALAQLSSAPPSAPLSAALGGMPQFKAPFNAAGIPQLLNPGNANQGLLAGLPCNDRALLAIGSSGSSVVISLEDVTSIWLSELDDPSASASTDPSGSRPPGPGGSRVKLEPTPVLLPPAPLSSSSRGPSCKPCPGPASFVPPLPYETFLPTSSAPITHVSTPSNPFPPTHPYMNATEPPQVTTALLSRLPTADPRKRFLKSLDETMLLHPCFNVRHFEQRVEAMMVCCDSSPSTSATPAPSSSGPKSREELARELFYPTAVNGKGPRPGKDSRTSTQQTPRPTLSFFAAASAALALGALVAREDAGDASASSGSLHMAAENANQCSPAALFALSDQALGLFEKTALYDLDSVIAMLLHVLYHLHDGQMSVAQGVFPLIGKMINVARMMGLAIDPDEFPGTYSLFEAETRRRIWWDVFYYDLFVSDCMGHPPLIADNSFTTRFPADVDEEQFSPSSTVLPAVTSDEVSEKSTAYFVLKCRLAQLVKNVKKQTFRDPLGDDELSVDQAAAFEGEVAAWLADLPPAFQLEMNHDVGDPVPPLLSLSPLLLAQRCELAILANRLILKLYLPFLRENKPLHQAIYGTINAAHLIIYASRMLHAVWQHTRPAAFDFYDFGRTLFDAAVVCAHAVIQQPTSILAPQAMKSLTCALEIMRELGSTKAGVEGTTAESNHGEAVRIVEMMKRKADAARGGSTPGASAAVAGTKRKRSAMEADGLASGFQLPFVGAAVASGKPGKPESSARPLASPVKLAHTNAPKEPVGGEPKSKGEPKRHASEKKDKEKAAKYPTVGIRVRPGQPQPAARQRPESVGPANGRGNAPSAGVGVAPASQPQPPPPPPPSQPHSTVSQSPTMATYDGYPSARPLSHSSSGPEPMSHDDYAMQYGTAEDRRYASQSFVDSPSGTALFDQSSLSHASPSSYSTGPTPPGYYVGYSTPAPPPTAYEQAGMSHSLGMGISAAPTPMDTSGGISIAPSMTNMSRDQEYLGPDKGHTSSYTPHIKPQEHARQMVHEYRPATAPSIAMANGHITAWSPQDGSAPGEMWTDYKYYTG